MLMTTSISSSSLGNNDLRPFHSPKSTTSLVHSSNFNEYQAYENNQYLLKNTYKYLKPIEKGSFGFVTLAQNIYTDQKVAMKAIFKNKKYNINIANHEIKILSKLGKENENICQLLDHFEIDDYIFLVLEFCENGDLFELIQHHKNMGNLIPAIDILNISKQLASGLNYAHKLGIYHRDIKPENVLFTDCGKVKICDWGLATTFQFTNEFDVGTEKYMAPECFKNSTKLTKIDCKYSDYWSLGITVITALFGRAPFRPIPIQVGESQTIVKSLESDYNFKNFVFNSKTDVLFDIFPSMNQNCFDIFMNLLRIGGNEDDNQDYIRKIHQRNLNQFVSDLENNWRFGLTIDEELEYEEEFDDLQSLDDKHMFDMDEHVEVPPAKTVHQEDDINGNVKSPVKKADRTTVVPSLTESSFQSKSWVELDEYTDEEFDQYFNSLTIDPKNSIKIIEKELTDVTSA